MSEDNIHISVQWENSTIFASENLECTIKFTNVTNSRLRGSSPGLRNSSRPRDRWREANSQHTRNSSIASSHVRSPSGIRSFDVRSPKLPESTNHVAKHVTSEGRSFHKPQQGPSHKNHRRSISIVSIGNDGKEVLEARPTLLKPRPNLSHARAASMQVLSRKSGIPSPGPRSAGIQDRAVTSPFFDRSPASVQFEPPGNPYERPRRNSERRTSNSAIPKIGQNTLGSFRFPPTPDLSEKAGPGKLVLAQRGPENLRQELPRVPPVYTNAPEPPNSLTKILSSASINETPRSSGEFFSMSNNSSETLASEYPAQESVRMLPAPQHRRQGSSLGPLRVPQAETLMMGFAQVTGSFILDGSLVNQTPFEEVKKKAIIGGQGGGGLVRSQSVKRESGFLGSLGWNNIGETFGGLLADTGMSSIKEAKNTAPSKAIPVLSASQSILFVDLQIPPGECKTFRFRHPIPKGSPPSYKGKAIKIQYNLVVGTQRAGKVGHQNQVKRTEIPFRVLPGINGSGDVVGHDLMSPHTLLSSGASVSTSNQSLDGYKNRSNFSGHGDPSKQSGELLSYVDKLLEHATSSDGAGLLSPTEDEAKNFASISNPASTMKDNIDLMILRGNQGQMKRNATRFEINRNGQKVAVVILPRAAYRIGETVPVVIDFQNADMASYSLHSALESFEIVDPLIALRSKASIQRVTRKVHASHHESTISAGRVFFNPLIPTHATPEFSTSGVSLQWNLRFEFVTDRAGVLDEYEDDMNDLMEEIAKDDRGTVHAAMQGLPCEVFEVAVPLRIFGACPVADQNAEVKMQA